MLGPYELLNKVMEHAKYKFDIGELSIPKTELRSYIMKIDSRAKIGNLDSVKMNWMLVGEY